MVIYLQKIYQTYLWTYNKDKPNKSRTIDDENAGIFNKFIPLTISLINSTFNNACHDNTMLGFFDFNNKLITLSHIFLFGLFPDIDIGL